MNDELADLHPGQPGAQEPPQERQRERRESDDLPPEELIQQRGRRGREGKETVEHGPQRTEGGRDEEWSQDLSRPRSRANELPQDQYDEEPGQDSVRRHRIRLLDRPGYVLASPQEQKALAREPIEVLKAKAPVVDEECCEREDDRDRIRNPEPQLLEPIRDASGRIRECGVPDEHVRNFTEQREHRERQGVVPVSELTREQRERRGDHQRAHAVAGAPRPRDETGDEEGPPGNDGRRGAGRRGERVGKVVDLGLVREDAEDDPRCS